MTHEDALAGPLQALAADSHAALAAGYDLDVVYERIADNPARGRFDAALAGDEMDALFPAGDAGYVFLTTGDGQHITRDVLPALIVAGAGKRLRALHDDTFRVEDLLEETARLIDRMRRLVRGEEVEFPMVSIFSGVGIAPEVNVELPWGVLAHPTRWANTWAEWSRGDLMLVTDVPIKIAIVEPGEAPEPPPEFAAEFDQVNEKLDTLERRSSLTLLLGLPRKPGAVRLWRAVLGPLLGQGFSTRGGNPRPLFGTQAHIDTSAAAALLPWARLVEERYQPRLNIATDRLISSITMRHDPGDALVDAVIALEAIFAGTDQGELSFRIAAALAALLEPDDAGARERVFKEARDLYAARSRIVHGQRPPTAEAGVLRDRAFELGTQALRRLYEHHPHLLGDDGRARRLILRV
ncbi:MAG: HEPN domain-containing protein [Actinomycetota bacterium]|nr:HEPN domain-containing protein [Actinomycetota bacterium]